MEARDEPPQVSRVMSHLSLPNFSVCHTEGPEGTGTTVGGSPGSRMPAWLPADIGTGCQRFRIRGRCPGMCDRGSRGCAG